MTSSPEAVWVLGPVPPPVNGMAVANQLFHEMMESQGLKIARPDRWSDIAPDGSIIYTSMSGGERAFIDLTRILQSSRRAKDIVVHHHSFAYLRSNWTRKDISCRLVCTMLARLLPECQHIFLCECMRDEYVRRYGIEPSRTHVLNNAWIVPFDESASVDENSWESRPRIRLGLLSNLCEEKGVFEAVRAVAEIKKRWTFDGEIELSLAGPISSSDARRVEELSAQLNVQTELCGSLYGDDKVDWLRELDMFLFPSSYRNEAYPIVLLEALAVGVPVFTSTIGCTEAIVQGARSSAAVGIEQFGRLGAEHLERLMSQPRPSVREDARRHFMDLRQSAEQSLSQVLADVFGVDSPVAPLGESV